MGQREFHKIGIRRVDLEGGGEARPEKRIYMEAYVIETGKSLVCIEVGTHYRVGEIPTVTLTAPVFAEDGHIESTMVSEDAPK